MDMAILLYLIIGEIMKYNVGDLIFIKNIDPRPRPPLRLRLRRRTTDHCRHRIRLRPRLDLDVFPHLKNTYGVIIEVINHSDAWEGQSAEDDNVYFWYSQVDAKTYWFCENELTEY